MIVTDFGDDVHTYLDQCAHLDFPRPAACLVCQVVGRMIGHGFYFRKALVVAGEANSVPIKRWICDACHHTVALLPSFLLPYRHYLLAVIQAVVITRFEDGAPGGKWPGGVARTGPRRPGRLAAGPTRSPTTPRAGGPRCSRPWPSRMPVRPCSTRWVKPRGHAMRRAPCCKRSFTSWPGPRSVGPNWPTTA
jgi:hypothetical protein